MVCDCNNFDQAFPYHSSNKQKTRRQFKNDSDSNALDSCCRIYQVKQMDSKLQENAKFHQLSKVFKEGFGLKFEDFHQGKLFFNAGMFRDLFLSYSQQIEDKGQFINVIERVKNSRVAEIHPVAECKALQVQDNQRIADKLSPRLDKLHQFLADKMKPRNPEVFQVNHHQKNLVFNFFKNKSSVYDLAKPEKSMLNMENCVILPGPDGEVRCFRSTSYINNTLKYNMYLRQIFQTRDHFMFVYFCRQIGQIVVLKEKTELD